MHKLLFDLYCTNTCGRYVYSFSKTCARPGWYFHRKDYGLWSWGKVTGFVHILYSLFTRFTPQIKRAYNTLGMAFIPAFHMTNNNDYKIGKGITI